MFGFFKKRTRPNPLDDVTLEMIRPARPTDPSSFTDQEAGTINGAFVAIQMLMRESGGDYARKWDEAWAWFQAQQPKKALAQCFMVKAFYTGLHGEPYLHPGEGFQIASMIGRSVALEVPNALDTRLAGLCQSVREAHEALLDRMEEADDALAAELKGAVTAP